MAIPRLPPHSWRKRSSYISCALLAFKTESTRCITPLLDRNNSATIAGPGETISDGYHYFSHHGKIPDKLAQLKVRTILSPS